ncbi:MAG: putative DNA binding domain-containing protein [Deltaproteobacteria bacterium]|nr:putative DNA binding domain-containing protein [Deltaproteobacteria bacterium]
MKQIEILLKLGESQKVEFKEGISPSLAREMVAFANGEGGKIFIGINDAGEVVGFETTNRLLAAIQDFARNCDPPVKISAAKARIKSQNILVIDVPEGSKKPYSCGDGYYLRVGPTSQKLRRDELIEFIQKIRPYYFDELPCPEFQYPKDFDKRAFSSFMQKGKIHQGDASTVDILKNLGVVAHTRGNKIIFNNAGVLFFAKEPRRFIPQSELTCVLFQGTGKADILDRKDMQGTLPENVEQAMVFLKRHLSLRYEIKTLQRKEILELPENALREAVLNAVVHRDYSIRGSIVMVEIYRDRVEIVDPGGLPPGMKRSDLGKRCVHRNPKLVDLFHRMGEIEKIGSGIRRMKDATKKAHVPPPRFEVTGFFVAVFKKEEEFKKLPLIVEKTVEKTVEKILLFVKTNPQITQKELMKKTGLTRRGIEWNLRKLKEDRKIRRIGPDKGGHWEILEMST